MSDELSAALPKLVNHARVLYQNSIACDYLRYYIDDIARVPDYAWSQVPWTVPWRKGWAAARDARMAEAVTMRDVLGQTAGGLLQVAADLSHTDIDISLTLDPFTGAQEHVQAHPGGHAGPAGYYVTPDDRDPDTGLPKYSGPGLGRVIDGLPAKPDGRRMSDLYQDSSFPQGYAGGTSPDYEAARIDLNTPGRDGLHTFIDVHYNTLQNAENDVFAVLGAAPGDSPTQYIDQAKDGWPGVIGNRADLMNVVATNYQTMRRDMATDVEELKQYWSSPGGSNAYYVYANAILVYFDTIGGEATWLATEGGKAADMLDALMLQYAKAGAQRIDDIANRLKSLKDSIDNDLCPDKGKANALLTALNVLGDLLVDELKAAGNDAKSTLNLAEIEMSLRSNLGSGAHGAKPFPASGSISDWQSGSEWTPGKAQSVVPTAPEPGKGSGSGG